MRLSVGLIPPKMDSGLKFSLNKIAQGIDEELEMAQVTTFNVLNTTLITMMSGCLGLFGIQPVVFDENDGFVIGLDLPIVPDLNE